MADRYACMYNVNLGIVINDKFITIDGGDIVSISFIHNYDTNTFPIIRLRLYSDLSTIQDILEQPDAIYVRLSMDGNIYRVNDEENSPVPVAGASSLSFKLKGYVENKNIPTSIMDQYEDGIRKTSDLNDNVKSPIEIYCYNELFIHYMKQKSPSIYKNMTIQSVIQDMLTRNNIRATYMDTIKNQTRYDQILIPNLSIAEAISYLDMNYGLFPKGGQIYGDTDRMFLTNSDVNELGSLRTASPIYVKSYKSNSDMTGMTVNTVFGKRIYSMTTNAANVSVITETDIERVLNAPDIVSINVSNLNIDIQELKKIFTDSINRSSSRKVSDGITTNYINTPQLLRKQISPYVLSSYVARLNEKITRIDVSGSGYDIGNIRINSRFNVIFESPIRGLNMNEVYRPTYACHVLSNMSGKLFVAQTSMNLVSN